MNIKAMHSVWLLAFGIIFLFSFRIRLFGLWDRWFTDGLSSIGASVPLLSAALVWRKRMKLRALPNEPNILGLPLLFVATAGANSLPSTGLLFATYWTGVVLVLGGFPFLRELAFPIGLLILVIPVPWPILSIVDYPLQLIAADITSLLLSSAGMEVIQEGPLIRLPHSSVIISPECNGLRSATALFLIGLVAAHIAKGPTWGRVLLPLLSLTIAYLSNFVRLFSTVTLTYALASNSLVKYEPHYDLLMGILTFIAASFLFARLAVFLKCQPKFLCEP